MHVMQIDWGFFKIVQSNLEVGQIVVHDGDHGHTSENWYLYSPGQGSPPQGYGVYTYPGPENEQVTTTIDYLGPPPQNFDPIHYQEQLQDEIGTGLVVEYTACDCAPPEPETQAKATKGGKASKAKPKAKAKAKAKTAARPKAKAKPKPKPKRKSR